MRQKLQLILLVVVLCLVFGWTFSKVFAHGGGLDSCGGHNDKKHGGYHVHNMALYCGCHPEAADCAVKSPSAPKQVKPAAASLAPTSPGDGGAIASLSSRVEKLEARVAALEKQLSGR